MTKLMWHRESGESRAFENDETPGPEYISHHPNDPIQDVPQAAAPGEPPAGPKPVEPPKEPAEKPMTKAEIVDALKSGGIEFDDNAVKGELEQLLTNKLKLALTEAEPPVEFTEDESARSLYGKLQAYFAAQAEAPNGQE